MKRYLNYSLALLLGIPIAAAAGSPEKRLDNLGIELPEASPSIANYVGAVRSGNLVFLSGHLPHSYTRSVRN